MLKLKVSGSIIKDGSSSDYEFNDVYMPDCPEEWRQLNVMRRAVPMRLTKDNKQFDHIRSCYIDSVETIKDDDKTNKEAAQVLEFKNKSIKDYTHEDCQNCAIAFQLVEVPIYRTGDIRETRQKTYMAYCKNVLRENVEKGFNYSVAPDLYVDTKKHKTSDRVMSNKELLDKISN